MSEPLTDARPRLVHWALRDIFLSTRDAILLSHELISRAKRLSISPDPNRDCSIIEAGEIIEKLQQLSDALTTGKHCYDQVGGCLAAARRKLDYPTADLITMAGFVGPSAHEVTLGFARTVYSTATKPLGGQPPNRFFKHLKAAKEVWVSNKDMWKVRLPHSDALVSLMQLEVIRANADRIEEDDGRDSPAPSEWPTDEKWMIPASKAFQATSDGKPLPSGISPTDAWDQLCSAWASFESQIEGARWDRTPAFRQAQKALRQAAVEMEPWAKVWDCDMSSVVACGVNPTISYADGEPIHVAEIQINELHLELLRRQRTAPPAESLEWDTGYVASVLAEQQKAEHYVAESAESIEEVFKSNHLPTPTVPSPPVTSKAPAPPPFPDVFLCIVENHERQRWFFEANDEWHAKQLIQLLEMKFKHKQRRVGWSFGIEIKGYSGATENAEIRIIRDRVAIIKRHVAFESEAAVKGNPLPEEVEPEDVEFYLFCQEMSETTKVPKSGEGSTVEETNAVRSESVTAGATMPSNSEPNHHPEAVVRALTVGAEAGTGEPISGYRRRGRLPKEVRETKRREMLDEVRKHPSLKDDPAKLAKDFELGESTIRRWLEEEEKAFREGRTMKPNQK